MLEELRDIERELDRMKRRIRRMIQLIEKRQVRLLQLSNEEILSEVGSRTLPATDIAELLGAAEKPRKKT
jgi:hypothetical protein